MNISAPKYHDFNKYGLRFGRAHLNMMYPKILELPIEDMAKYVDLVTYKMLRYSPDEIKEVENHVYINQSGFNATTFGNTAFVARYHPDESIRTSYLEFIMFAKKLYGYE
jgi:hypothetical protein